MGDGDVGPAVGVEDGAVHRLGEARVIPKPAAPPPTADHVAGFFAARTE